MQDGIRIRWVDFTQPARHGSPWLEWVRRHGIDPNHVGLDSLECDDERRTITYRTVDHGRHVLILVQLEAPALPFPETDEFTTGVAEEGVELT